jgi:hypothetical protein
MVVHDLKKTFEERRLHLIGLLEDPKSGLDLSKKHQVYGAIREIEHVLRTLDTVRESEIASIDLAADPDPRLWDKISALLKK